MRTRIVFALLSALTFFSACKKSAEVKNTSQPAEAIGGGLKATAAPSFAYGADISWITEQEASGKKFYNSSGTQQDIFTVIKSKGINAVRFRVWETRQIRIIQQLMLLPNASALRLRV